MEPGIELNMPIYLHRQPGTKLLVTIFIVFLAVVAVLFARYPDSIGLWVLSALAIMALVTLLFWSLSVEVTSDRVRVWFGSGLISRSFEVGDIRAVSTVRNRWFYGWGIRRTPHGWMFNLWGLDAVELELNNGKRFRIGTDQPGQLQQAIEQALEGG